jgi:pantothenate synthetase
MSKPLSPFQIYVKTWWTEEESKIFHHEIVRQWNRLSMSERSQYVGASKRRKSLNKNSKIFQI